MHVKHADGRLNRSKAAQPAAASLVQAGERGDRLGHACVRSWDAGSPTVPQTRQALVGAAVGDALLEILHALDQLFCGFKHAIEVFFVVAPEKIQGPAVAKVLVARTQEAPNLFGVQHA